MTHYFDFVEHQFCGPIDPSLARAIVARLRASGIWAFPQLAEDRGDRYIMDVPVVVVTRQYELIEEGGAA